MILTIKTDAAARVVQAPGCHCVRHATNLARLKRIIKP